MVAPLAGPLGRKSVIFPFLACAEIESESGDATVVGPFEPRFTFAILADPHVSDASENLDRLDQAVAWIADNAEIEDIQLTLILGDIAWSEGFPYADESLSALPMPWVPILGDNEIQFGGEQTYDDTYSDQYAALATQLDHFTRGETPIDNPEYGQPSWFQNLSFDFGEVHFVGLDWCTRHIGGLEGEAADLHDFSGGTLRWLESDLQSLSDGPDERVIFASHHPMHLSPGGFDLTEVDTVDTLLSSWDDAIYANFAGHYHFNEEEVDTDRPLDIYVTDATWDDVNTIRLVSVEGNGAEMKYTHRFVEL